MQGSEFGRGWPVAAAAAIGIGLGLSPLPFYTIDVMVKPLSEEFSWTRGDMLSDIEDWTRYIIIPTLIITAISSLLGYGPFAAGEGQKWYSAKILTFGLMLCIGFVLRVIMHEWRRLFPALAAGPNPEAEAKLKSSIRLGRTIAYVYWFGIMTTAFFGAVKPF